MLLVDANVLLFAVNRGARAHREARAWVESALTEAEPVGFAWTVVLAFLRIATRTSVLPRALDVHRATDLIEVMLAQPASVVVHPTDRHAAVLSGLLRDVGTAGNLVTDAHLAALAIEHGATIVSYDRDFQRFPGVRARLPA